jgi:thiamine biosynthesis lipoprotein
VQFSEHFRAMNTDIDIVIGASEAPVAAFIETRLLFEQQEARFSRFRDGSLLSRLNRGEAIDDPWLDTALELAIEAHGQTGGLFNPMVLPALARAGYDKSFDLVTGGAPARAEVPSPSSCLDRSPNGWRLVAGAVDLGGIVKGWTADLAVEHLETRFPDVFLNAGGDIRCAGAEGGKPGWKVEVDAPGGGIAWAGPVQGAIATSSTLKRRWKTDAGEIAHHLIDPRTGLPARTPFAQVTARAESCTWAEVWAKAVLIGGSDGLELAGEFGLPVLALGASGERHATRAW